MSFCLANQFFQQFLFVPEPQVQLPKFIDKKSPSGVQLRRIYQLHFKDYARFKFSPIAVSSGAASPSPAEYSGNWAIFFFFFFNFSLMFHELYDFF